MTGRARAEAPAVLEMRGISRRFDSPAGPVFALREADLSIRQGEFVGLTGPSGSGKSTLLHLAGLLDRPTSGRVLFDGRDASEATDDELCRFRKEGIGIVFQKGCLLPHRSALQNVMFRFRYLDSSGVEARELSLRALERVGLGTLADRPARLLSGGEAGRVAVARAVAREPRLLIADEPTGSLDADSGRAVMECFRALHRSGATILLATHNETLLDYCTRRLVCRAGVVR